MTTITRARHWAEAFMHNGNSTHAQRVRTFLREHFGFTAIYDSDYSAITRLETSRGDYDWWDDIEGSDLEDTWHNIDTVVRFMMNECFNHEHVRTLDQKFLVKTSNIGSYTKIPFPKEVKNGNNVNANN